MATASYWIVVNAHKHSPDKKINICFLLQILVKQIIYHPRCSSTWLVIMTPFLKVTIKCIKLIPGEWREYIVVIIYSRWLTGLYDGHTIEKPLCLFWLMSVLLGSVWRDGETKWGYCEGGRKGGLRNYCKRRKK